MKKTFEVTLLNQKFNLKTDNDPKYVQRVSDYVNKKIFEVQEKTKSVSSLNVALLAALNIADDFFKIKESNKELKQEAGKKVKEIVNFIDHCLEEA